MAHTLAAMHALEHTPVLAMHALEHTPVLVMFRGDAHILPIVRLRV